MKKPYEKPRIDGIVSIRTDSSIMAASVVNEGTNVQTQGHEVNDMKDFTFDWEQDNYGPSY